MVIETQSLADRHIAALVRDHEHVAFAQHQFIHPAGPGIAHCILLSGCVGQPPVAEGAGSATATGTPAGCASPPRLRRIKIRASVMKIGPNKKTERYVPVASISRPASGGPTMPAEAPNT